MTNPTPHGQVPEALAHERDRAIMEGERNASLDAYSRVVLLTSAESRLYDAAFTNGWDRCAAHVQNPTKIEHVAGDASENGAELDTSQQPAPAAVVYSTLEEMFDAILTPQPAPATQQAGDLPESLVKWAYSPELVETGNHWQQGYEHARAWVHVQLSCSNIAPSPPRRPGRRSRPG